MKQPVPLSLWVAVIAAASGCPKKDDADGGGDQAAKAEVNEPAAHEAAGPAHAVDRQRAELDESVWAAEVAAQEYERAFVSLWDAMRAAEDPSVPLAAFSFQSLSLPALGEPTELGDGVTRRESTDAREDLKSADFATRIDAMRASGWKLAQSEFHHSTFEPGTPARSVVSFLLHLHHPEQGRRTAVHGKLHVTWGDGKDARGNHIVDRVEVRDLSVVERRGGLAFERVRTLEPRPENSPDPRVQPVLLYDLDGDGLSEIVLAGANRVYWNRGNMKFEDGPLLEKPVGFITSAAFGDLDGDGDTDLLAGVAGAPPLFFEGQGKPGGKVRFPVEGRELAVLPAPLLNPLALTLGDIDADGDLDAYVTQYKRPYVMGQMPTPYYDANDGFAAYLLVNDGKAVFEDKTQEAGLAPKRYRRTYSTSFLDLDDDHDLDLLVVSDFSGIDVHLNDGKGTFTDVTEEWVDERASFGMSYTQGDYDLDGRRDLYVVGMSSTTARRLEQLGLGRDEFAEHQGMRMKMAYGNRIYLGGADHHLAQAPFADALARTGWSWGSSSFDFDRDGDLDIYVANGNVSRGSAADYCTTYWRHDIYTGNSQLDQDLGQYFIRQFDEAIANGVSWNGYEHNKLFVNQGGEGFSEQGWPLGVALEDDSRAVVSDDLDGDGRVDLVVVLSKSLRGPQGELFHEKAAVLRNTWPGPDAKTPNHWIGIRLGGERSPIGARIRVSAGGKEREHEIVVGDSLLAQHAPAHLFGLGETDKVDWVRVRWLDGHERELAAPKADRWHVLDK